MMKRRRLALLILSILFTCEIKGHKEMIDQLHSNILSTMTSREPNCDNFIRRDTCIDQTFSILNYSSSDTGECLAREGGISNVSDSEGILSFRNGDRFERPMYRRISTSKIEIQKPYILEHCREWTLCVNVSNYPPDYLYEKPNLIWDRSVDYIYEELERSKEKTKKEICPHETIKVENPNAAKDEKDIWHFLYTIKNESMYEFEYEICKFDRCYDNFDPINDDVICVCKQKYYYKTMKIYNIDGEVEDKIIPIPSTCVPGVTIIKRSTALENSDEDTSSQETE